MKKLKAISGREASIFAALCEAFVAPAGDMPPVRDTDAAFALDANLAAAPPFNRFGLRLGLYALEIAPLLMGHRARLRRLDTPARADVIARLKGSGPLGQVLEGYRALAHLCYYGDLAVMRSFGYDPQLVVDRAARLRVTEARW